MDNKESKNLKKGQDVYIKAKFLGIGNTTMEDTLYVKINRTDSLGMGFELVGQSCHIPIEDIVIPTPPKHSPARLFKKGDVVRVVAWNGRDIARIGQIGRVVSDEHNSRVELAIEGWTKDVFYPACHLEIVTPVEEMARYRVELLQDGLPPDTYHFWAVMDNSGHEVARFWCEQYEKGKAKAAAEAERDRLNAEWRKEHGNV